MKLTFICWLTELQRLFPSSRAEEEAWDYRGGDGGSVQEKGVVVVVGRWPAGI